MGFAATAATAAPLLQAYGDWFPSHIDDIKTRPFDQNLAQCLLAFEFLNSFRQDFFYFPQLPTITAPCKGGFLQV